MTFCNGGDDANDNDDGYDDNSNSDDNHDTESMLITRDGYRCNDSSNSIISVSPCDKNNSDDAYHL